jgi:hypothetical protein
VLSNEFHQLGLVRGYFNLDRKEVNMSEFIFNGINGATGDYDLPPQSSAVMAKVARGIPLDNDDRRDIAIRRSLDQQQVEHFGIKEGADPTDLSQSGWGVIFPQSLDAKTLDGLREALKPLLDHRREQAAKINEIYYKECLGELGYHTGQSKNDFLKMFGRGPGPADPDKLPYYLLIVGAPHEIPYSFQYQLDVQYAMGRIQFDNLEDYYRYAVSVVEVEKRGFSLPRQAVFFGPSNEDDGATQLSAENLIKPLSDYVIEEENDWQVQTRIKEAAYRADFDQLLHASQPPALLFSASHGMVFPNGDQRQFPHQGALLCQDWPGPRAHKGPIPEDFYYSADHLGDDASLLGMLSFFFACYGAGTPRMDDFHRRAFIDQKEIAPAAFLAELPQKMLSHPKGAALAVVGHVERAWGYSFLWEGVGQDLVTFESTLKRLMEGHPVGSALEYFNSRYAELSTDLTTELDETDEDTQNDVKIAGLWTANKDARNYMIIGDPAVRMSAGEKASPAKEATAIVELLSESPLSGAPDETKETQQPEPVPVTVTSSAAQPGVAPVVVDYGLGDTFRKAGTSVSDGLQTMVSKLSNFLGKALEDATSLEVATYVSDDLSTVEYKDGKFSDAKLRALTHIKIDGDTLAVVPETDGEVDADLWKIHLEMVQQAQASRAELVKTAVSAVTGLADLLKP